jgi:hypothetical protein
MHRLGMLLSCFVLLLVLVSPVFAEDAVRYSSQPDRIAIFYNNIAFAHDEITLPSGTDVQIVLPITLYADTLVLREDGERIPNYRLVNSGSEYLVEWQSASTAAVRQVTLDYLMSGLSWKPKYDLFLIGANPTAQLDFFAEISANTFDAEGVDVRLVAGTVDTAQMVDYGATASMNQYIAGYAEPTSTATLTGSATIQYIYNMGELDLVAGATIYTRITDAELPARKVHLWNAQADTKVTVIYKLLNETEFPFADGIVRSYQDGMFLGSDGIELTPPNSEGSVTVGTLQNVRVNRTESTTAISSFLYTTKHDIALNMTNFGEEAITIEVVDYYSTNAFNFEFATTEPERQGDNLFRWTITIEPGATETITYTYVS